MIQKSEDSELGVYKRISSDTRAIGEEERTYLDGNEMFSEHLRLVINKAINLGLPPKEDAIDELRRLTQQERPSGQAEYYLAKLRKESLIPQIPHQDYDTVMHEAWQVSTEDPVLAQRLADHVGVLLLSSVAEFYDNGITPAPPSSVISEQLVP